MMSPVKIFFYFRSVLLILLLLSVDAAAQRLIKINIVRSFAYDTTIYIEFSSIARVCPCPRGIPEENFEVYDDSIKIKQFEFYWGQPHYMEPKLTYAYILDASIWNNENVRKTTYQLVDAIRDSIDEGMLVIARIGKAFLQNAVGSSRAMITNSLDTLSATTAASIYDAINLCYDSISINNRNPEMQKIILITAGKDSGSSNQFENVQLRIFSQPTSVITVGMNISKQSPAEDTLKEMSLSSPNGIYIYEPDSSQIENLKCNIRTYEAGLIDVNYIKYHDPHPKDGKQHYIKLIAHDCGVADTIYYFYKYKQQTLVEDETHAIKFKLDQNYPNPFSNSTAISFKLLALSHVRLEVFDLLGRKVATLVDREMDAGEHSILFDARKFNLHSGIYFYELRNGGSISRRKMLVMN